MNIKAIIFLLLISHPIAYEDWEYFIVWDVGQGQFLTLVETKKCIHIDVGGEYFNNIKQLQRLCYKKTNQIYLTHGDWDHLSFLKRIGYWLPNICIANINLKSIPKKRRYLIRRFKKCSSPSSIVRVVFTPTLKKQYSANDLSSVFIVKNKILIPGDSTKKMEKIWRYLLPRNPSIQHLVLGHHGSKTSTSINLLRFLPDLSQSTCSARKKKYGHPHILVQKNLRDFSLRSVCTEEFGTMIFKL